MKKELLYKKDAGEQLKQLFFHVLKYGRLISGYAGAALSVLVFSILFLSPRLVEGQTFWQSVANEDEIASAASSYTTVATAKINSQAVPYVAYVEDGAAKVKRYFNYTWEAVGGNVSDGNASYTNIFIGGDNKIYVAYVDNDNDHRLAVKTYNSGTNAWEPLGGDAANLYLSAGSVVNGTSQLVSSHNSWMAFDSGNVPYVVFGEMGTAGGNPFVKRFVNGAWETVGGAAVSADKASGVGIDFDSNNNPYITYAGGTGSVGQITVYEYTDNQWQNIAVPATITDGPATNVVRHPSMVVLNDKIYVLYMDTHNSNKATVITFDSATSSWSQAGGTLSGRDVSYLTLTKDAAGDLLASFIDIIANKSGRSVTRVMKLTAETTDWTEIKNSDSAAGIDEPTQYPSISAGSDNSIYLVYTKTNSSNIVTPVVQMAAAGSSEGDGSEQAWQSLANDNVIASAASSYTTVATASSNSDVIPYVAYIEGGIAKVKKYQDHTWQAVGGNVSDGNASYTNIFIGGDNKIYVAYVDNDNDHRLAVKTYNSGTNAWEPLNGDAANLYLSAGSVVNGTSQLVSSHNSWMAFDSNNVPYVIFGEMGTAGGSPFVKRFVNGAWETVGGAAVSADKASGVGIAMDSNNNPYIVYSGGTGSTGQITVYEYTNNQWQNIAVPASITGGPATNGARHTSIAIVSDKMYVLYMNGGNSSKATVIAYDNASSSWSQVGGTLSGRDVTYLTLIKDASDDLFASFIDIMANKSGRSVTRVMKLTSGETTWVELKSGDAQDGIDEPTQNPSIAAGIDNSLYLVYTKAGSDGVVTPNVKVIEGTGIIDDGNDTWHLLGDEDRIASATSSYTTIATGVVNSSVVPYVAYTEGGIAKVKRYIGYGWESVGGNVSDGNASYTNIFIGGDNKIYVAYVDNDNDHRLAVKTYNLARNTWEPLNRNAANLYLSAGSVVNGTSQLVSSHNSWMAFDSNNVPYVIFSEMGTAAGSPFVKRFVNGAWETVGGAAISADKASGVGIAMDSNNNPYIVYSGGTGSTGQITVYEYTNNQWQNIAVPAAITDGPATNGARHTSIAIVSDKMYVLYMNGGNSSKATVITYDNASSSWSQAGGTLSGRDVTYTTLIKDVSGDLLASFIDIMANKSGRSVTRVMELAPGGNEWVELKNSDTQDGIDEPTQNPSVATGINSSIYVAYTKANSQGVITPVVKMIWGTGKTLPDEVVTTPKQMESLDRGVVAVRSAEDKVYIGWRMFGTDPEDISFNVYRGKTKITPEPITNSTNFEDNTTTDETYTVVPVIGGVEQTATSPVSVWAHNYLSIPLQAPAGGTTPDGVSYTYNANDCSVADLDGDGEYEIILKWDPSNSKDNSQDGYTGNVYLDAYKLNGKRLWRIDLGKNIRAGAHYTQFIAYDLDGDGKAEVACKTADGTIDGTGQVIGDASADYRNSDGYILTGPEFLTVFNGLTGAAMASTDFLPARGNVSDWGDDYGNRVDRFVAAVAYLDGARPSLIMGRGYYTRLVRAAWDWRNGKLTSRWVFDSNKPGNSAYAGQGNHQVTVGDVDGDGKDELCNGASAINDNGKGLYSTGLGHGDALHMSDLDPDRPGEEVWQAHEEPEHYGDYGLEFRDAKTGEVLWGVPGDGKDVGRAMAADIDPNHKGDEVWGAVGGLYTAQGTQISTNTPSMNFGIWWDGDLSRELLDGTEIDKWDYANGKLIPVLKADNYADAASNNGTKANPGLVADILGDWREEVIYRSSDNTKLMLFTTTDVTTNRLYTLMHDPQYREAIAWQNTGYNQPPHPGFYLGNDMAAPPAPNITLTHVTQQAQTITFNALEPVKMGNADFDAGATASSELPVFYSSSDESVATIVGGKIHLVGVGTTTITASQPGNLLWIPAADVTQALEVQEDPRAVQTITFNTLPEKRVGNDDFDPAATASSGLPVSYSSSDETVATVVDGKLHMVGKGTTTITASQPGDDTWRPAEDVTQTLNVLLKNQQIITFYNAGDKKLGDADFDPAATATSTLPVTYTSSDESVATIVNGKIHIVGQGTAVITASQEGDDTWASAVAVTQTINVSGLAELAVHQALSPNGDGKNDFLLIDGIEGYPDNVVTVVSRDGERLFRTSNYDNTSKVFKGKNDSGENLPAGTYFYLIEYSLNGKKEHKTGYFVIKY